MESSLCESATAFVFCLSGGLLTVFLHFLPQKHSQFWLCLYNHCHRLLGFTERERESIVLEEESCMQFTFAGNGLISFGSLNSLAVVHEG